MRDRRAWLTAGALACAWGAALPALARPAVRTLERDPVVARRTYDPDADRPVEMPLSPGRDAFTVCDFWCKPVLSYRTLARDAGEATCRATVEMTEAQVVLELTVTSWLPHNASRRLARVEAAHRDICTETYRQFAQAAREAAPQLLSGTFAAEAGTCREAVDEAVRREATASLCVPFTSTSGAAARRVSDLFDALLRGSGGVEQAPSIGGAMRAAFELYHEERERDPLVASPPP